MRLALVLLLAACGSAKKEDPGPTCAQLTDHLLQLMSSSMPPGHGNMRMGDKKSMNAHCEEKHMDAKTRTCVLAAKTMPEAAACAGMTPPAFDKREPTPKLDMGSGGSAGGTGSATGMGSGSSAMTGSGSAH